MWAVIAVLCVSFTSSTSACATGCGRKMCGRACTVEEYLRKRFRYQMTPYAVEIERLVLGLEKVRGYGGSLEPSLFETIEAALRELHRRQGVFQPGEAEALWEELYGTFVRLTENASDYIASLQSARAEELMATEAFLTGYLQSFVQGLQRHAFKIEGLIPALAPQVVAAFLDAVTTDIGRRPQLNEPFDAAAVRERLEGEWQSLVHWFVGTPAEASDVLNRPPRIPLPAWCVTPCRSRKRGIPASAGAGNWITWAAGSSAWIQLKKPIAWRLTPSAFTTPAISRAVMPLIPITPMSPCGR
ncbi:hypothetical protein MOMUL_28890 [Moorella mulderi DSM 14980]|uniref:Uncharacterized protein n=1 Tax=Moorella mulderi DSM 14980 TaxID=1122241 RepID=A0A151AT39_9FIRM|nr:DUF2397 domain-containing protein [Moorella mulderi]KYH30824.1 hypothetical protein MOMUL_28890 [Moorella mulderi DSM 14980]